MFHRVVIHVVFIVRFFVVAFSSPCADPAKPWFLMTVWCICMFLHVELFFNIIRASILALFVALICYRLVDQNGFQIRPGASPFSE